MQGGRTGLQYTGWADRITVHSTIHSEGFQGGLDVLLLRGVRRLLSMVSTIPPPPPGVLHSETRHQRFLELFDELQVVAPPLTRHQCVGQ